MDLSNTELSFFVITLKQNPRYKLFATGILYYSISIIKTLGLRLLPNGNARIVHQQMAYYLKITEHQNVRLVV